MLPPAEAAVVLAGLEVLVQRDFAPMRGKRFAVLTHLAARDVRNAPAHHTLLGSPAGAPVRVLVPLGGWDPASPESPAPSMLRAEPPGAEVAEVPVVDLAASGGRPRANDLAGLDLLVVDLQDTGWRNSPALNTLAMTLEECYLAGVAVLVLDRPNPLGGLLSGGPIQTPDFYSLPASYFPMPLQHGMTIGEAARLMNDFLGIGARLEVVGITGWSRTMSWARTNRPWSPAMGLGPDPSAAFLHGPLQLARMAGAEVAPDGTVGIAGPGPAALLRELQAVGMPGGYRAEVVSFMGRTEMLHGVRLSVENPREAAAADLAMALLSALRRAGGPEARGLNMANVLPVVGNPAAMQRVEAGTALASLRESWQGSLAAFEAERLRATLYRN